MARMKAGQAPSWVRDLGQDQAQKWADVFNETFEESGDETTSLAAASAAVRLSMARKCVSAFVPIDKVDAERRMVWGYASTEALDSAGDRIALSALREALPDYMKFANIREMHQPSAVGRTVAAVVDDVGLYIGGHIVDDAAWKKVQARVYNGFSVGGWETGRDGEWITGLKLAEISLADRPSNPESVFDIWKIETGGGNAQMFNLKKYGGPENASEEDVTKFLDKLVSERDQAAADKRTHLEKNLSLEKQLAEVKGTAAEALELQAKVEKLEKANQERDENEQKARMKKLLDSAIAAGKFEASDRPDWEKIFKADEKACERQLSKMKAVVPIGKRVGAGGDGEESTFDQCEALIQKIMTDEKVAKDVAYDKARRRNPKLFAKYDAEHLEAARIGGAVIEDSAD